MRRTILTASATVAAVAALAGPAGAANPHQFATPEEADANANGVACQSTSKKGTVYYDDDAKRPGRACRHGDALVFAGEPLPT